MRPFKILFVDDEPNLLSGLRRMLRPFRKEWDLHFAAGGNEALLLLEKDQFDLIVTDMKMPDVDGVALLSSVLSNHPETIRFILSGQAEENSLLKATSVAHQFISKPCQAEILRERINQALDVLRYENGIEIVAEAALLPVSSAHQQELESVLVESAGTEEILTLLQKDPVLCAKSLQLSNGSFFGESQICCNSEDALQHLDISMFKAVLSESGILSSELPDTLQFDWNWFYSVSQAAGTLSSHLGLKASLSETMQRELYTAGLLHRIGTLLIAYRRPEEYLATCNPISLPDSTPPDQSFHMNQFQISAGLLSLWSIPEQTTKALERIALPDTMQFHKSQIDPYLYVSAYLAQKRDPIPSQAFEISFCPDIIKKCSEIVGVDSDNPQSIFQEAFCD